MSLINIISSEISARIADYRIEKEGKVTVFEDKFTGLAYPVNEKFYYDDIFEAAPEGWVIFEDKAVKNGRMVTLVRP